MDKIIVDPTATSQWNTLVAEASNFNNKNLSPELESYLVFLLMRFTSAPEIADSIVAINLLESAHQNKTQQQQTLRDIGDTCLLFTGLFPGRAQKRRLRISYYVKIGQTAYMSLSSNFKNNSCANLFAALGEQFVTLMETLQAMREIDGTQLALDPMQAEEVWHDTGSSHALKTLEKFTSTRPMPPTSWSTAKH